MTKYLTVVSMLALAVVLTACDGCSKNGAVQIPHSVEQEAARYNAVLAETAKGVVDGTIALNTSGVISDDQTRPVLEASRKAAIASKSVAEIMKAPGDWSTKAPQIQGILDALTFVPNLPSSANTALLLSSIESLNVTIKVFKEAIK